MEFKNFMEDYVLKKMEEILPNYPQCCTCDKCKRDIVTLTLNNLQSKYVTSDKGEMLVRAEIKNSVHEIEVVTKITNSIKKVMLNPHHDKG